MKYIRTRKGIYEIEYSIETDIGLLIRGKNQKLFNKPNEYKQADTIEELCDRFVLITNIAHYGFGHFRNIKSVVLGKEEKFVACYGAIWTDKGLIYVAKMNDKGELELVWVM